MSSIFNNVCDNIIYMEKFIERLKELREENKLSQAKLAKATGISQSAIGFWETGKRIPNALAIITLARFFEVSTDYLLGEED